VFRNGYDFLYILFNYPSQISPLLWLGDSSNSRDLSWLMEHNVSFILNCAAECANHHTEQLNYLHLRLLDKPEESVRRAFAPAITFLEKAHEAGQVSSSAITISIFHCRYRRLYMYIVLLDVPGLLLLSLLIS
jgi:hypothetical protein